MQTHPPMTDLPEHWQEHILHLRRDRARLRKLDRVTDLPQFWQQKITDLRTEAARLRVERNVLRDDVAVLRAELEAGTGGQ